MYWTEKKKNLHLKTSCVKSLFLIFNNSNEQGIKTMELKTDSSITNIFYLSLVGAMKQRTEQLANPDPPNFISFLPL